MTLTCITCTSSRTLATGPRAGSLWCFVKRNPVNPDGSCRLVLEIANPILNRMDRTPSQRVLVKSAVESQFETNCVEMDGRKTRLSNLSFAQYPVAP